MATPNQFTGNRIKDPVLRKELERKSKVTSRDIRSFLPVTAAAKSTPSPVQNVTNTLDRKEYSEVCRDGATFFPTGYSWHPRTVYYHILASNTLDTCVIYYGTNYYEAIHPLAAGRYISSDSFATDLAAGWWRIMPTWAAGVTYNLYDRVKFGDEFYICNLGHLSSASNAPDQVGAPWNLLFKYHAYLIEPANWFNPVADNINESNSDNSSIDVYNRSGQFSGNGWIPFEASGHYTFADNRLIHHTDTSFNTMSYYGSMLYPSHFGNQNMQYHHTESQFTKKIRFFKPEKKGLYLLNIAIHLSIYHLLSISVANTIHRIVRGMLALQRWNAYDAADPSEFFMYGSDPLQILTPIRVKANGVNYQTKSFCRMIDSNSWLEPMFLDPNQQMNSIPTRETTDYNPVINYGQYNLVYNTGNPYLALVDSPVGTPGSSPDWLLLDINPPYNRNCMYITLHGRVPVPCEDLDEIYIPWYKIYDEGYTYNSDPSGNVLARRYPETNPTVLNYTLPTSNAFSIPGFMMIKSYVQYMEATYIGEKFELLDHDLEIKHAVMF